tara:strand:- start:282 stop:602 length:321 start_codon:yes stop_codon:yes gene_type:complete
MIETVKAVPVTELIKVVEKLFKKQSGHPISDAGSLMTTQEWKDRGEPHGNGSYLTLVSEGWWSETQNYGTDKWKNHTEWIEELSKVGWYTEQGFHWTWHFYKIGGE